MWRQTTVIPVVVVLSAGPSSVWSSDALQYPYKISQSVKKLEKKLEKRCSFQFDSKNTTIEEAIRKVGEFMGEKIKFDVRPNGYASLNMRDSPARSVIRLLLKKSPTKAELLVTEEKGLVVTDRPERYPIIKKREVQHALQWVRSAKFPTRQEIARKKKAAKEREKKEREQERAFEEIRKKLQSTRVFRDFIDVPIPKIISELGKLVGIPMILFRFDEQRNTKLSIRGESRSVQEILYVMGFSYTVEGAAKKEYVLIHPQGESHKPVITEFWDPDEGEDEDKKEHLKKLRELFTVIVVSVPFRRTERDVFSKEISFRPKKPTILGNYQDDLSRQLGLPVFMGHKAWKARLAVQQDTRISVRELAERLKEKCRLEFVLDLNIIDVEQGRFGSGSFAIYILDPAAW